IRLEYDYLSSAERLLEFQSLYFEDELMQRGIGSIKVFKINNKEIEIKDLTIIKN